MGSKVDFSNEMYSVLAGGEGEDHSQSEYDTFQYPLWDILKELDRRSRRTVRDYGSKVRNYMREHAKEVEKVKKKHGL